MWRQAAEHYASYKPLKLKHACHPIKITNSSAPCTVQNIIYLLAANSIVNDSYIRRPKQDFRHCISVFYITAPSCHGTNSIPPNPNSSLLDFLPEAISIISSKISSPHNLKWNPTFNDVATIYVHIFFH